MFLAMHYQFGIIAVEIDENICAETHYNRLNDIVVPEMKRRAEAKNFPFEKVGYLEDGAPAHASRIVSDFLRDTFGERVVAGKFRQWHGCGENWPSHSPGQVLKILQISKRHLRKINFASQNSPRQIRFTELLRKIRSQNSLHRSRFKKFASQN